MFNFTFTCYFKDLITGELTIQVIPVVANSRSEAEAQIAGLECFHSIIMLDSVIESTQKQKLAVTQTILVKKNR